MKLEVTAAVVAIVLFSTGDALAAAWGKTGKWWYFALMLLAGNVAWICFAYLNKTMSLASVSGIVNLGLVILSLVLSVALFKEKLLPLEKAGIVVGLIALTLFAAARMSAPATEPSA